MLEALALIPGTVFKKSTYVKLMKLVECLPSKHEGLSLKPSTTKTNNKVKKKSLMT
jgi:hypothetical protein